MITKENLKDVLNQISLQDKIKIIDSNKEYCVVELHVFNVGSYTSIKLIDDIDSEKFDQLVSNGNCLLETQEVIDILNE